MQWGSLIGLALAWGGIMIGQLLEGGHLSSLVQGSALCIVLCGTLGAVILQSGMRSFVLGVKKIRWIVLPPPDLREQLIALVVRWAKLARREGRLHLEAELASAPDRFCHLALQLVVDNTDAVKLRDILDLEMDTAHRALRNAVKIWDAAGGYAPTVGILGAVLGLIHVMENLSDPSRLGSGIAVAFVATIYGVGLANLIFLPVANNLKQVVAREIGQMEMFADGMAGIASGEHPVVIEARMRAHG
jgi:chemotaxis protein MotA